MDENIFAWDIYSPSGPTSCVGVLVGEQQTCTAGKIGQAGRQAVAGGWETAERPVPVRPLKH